MADAPHLITRENKYKPANVYTTKSFDISGLDHHYNRADIEFHGLDHSEASYKAHIFLGNPGANADTPRTLENGYAGNFDVFGHGGCFGDEGHCSVPTERRVYDPRPGHPLHPMMKTVIATEAIKRAVAKSKEVTVTVVPLVTAATNKCDIDNVFHCKNIRLIAYR